MADNRGGARSPSPNTLYPNRSDMAQQPVQTPKGQPYGTATSQAQAQQAVPVAGSPTAGTPQSNPLEGLQPGQVPTLADPSAYPSEPVTAGLPSGPGPGPEALRSGAFSPPSLSILREVYARYPNDDLRRLIEQAESSM